MNAPGSASGNSGAVHTAQIVRFGHGSRRSTGNRRAILNQADLVRGGLAVFVSGQAQVGGVSAWMRSRVRRPIWLIAMLLSA